MIRKVLAVVVLLLVMASPTLGARPLSIGSPTWTVLSVESNRVEPFACFNDGDFRDIEYQLAGSLTPGQSVSFSARFCDPSIDGVSAGGQGLFVQVRTKGATISVTGPCQDEDANWPAPPYPCPVIPTLPLADFTGAICVVPEFALDGSGHSGSIEGGYHAYQVRVANNTNKTVRDIYLRITVQRAEPELQQALCPVSYQNLE